jgi:hypothetical protein
MRIPRKRELAALWLLYERGSTLNLGEALDILRSELCVTKRTARNIIKRLRKLGIVEVRVKEGELELKIGNPVDVFKRVVDEYILQRKKRCRLPDLKRDEEGRTL